MRFLVNFFIAGLFFITLKTYLEGRDSEFELVRSTLDDKEYLVRNLPDKVEAANNLCRIKNKLNSVVYHLSNSEKHKDEPRVKRLVENYQEDVLSEAPKNSKHTSYSINKGERIYFCIRQRDDANTLVDINTVTFVALHELAHVMTKSIGHTQEFWDNFKFLLENAIQRGLYDYQPFHLQPVKYCGSYISDTPLKVEKNNG